VAWEVRWAQAAWDDLERIADYIALDSPSYAGAFVQELIEASRSLAQMAERGRVVPEWNEPHVRELFVGNYRLIYEVSKRFISIIGLVHGARDLGALWRREGRQPSQN
jgi:plasmid stabilization system protein ParE